jgi:hypothetical protein
MVHLQNSRHAMDQNGMQDRVMVATLFSGGTLDSSNVDPGGIAPESSTETSIENSILPTNTTDGTLHSSIADPGGIALESCTETSIEDAILPTNTTDGTLDSSIADPEVTTPRKRRRNRRRREKERHVAPRLSNSPKESIVIPLLRSNYWKVIHFFCDSSCHEPFVSIFLLTQLQGYKKSKIRITFTAF